MSKSIVDKNKIIKEALGSDYKIKTLNFNSNWSNLMQSANILKIKNISTDINVVFDLVYQKAKSIIDRKTFMTLKVSKKELEIGCKYIFSDNRKGVYMGKYIYIYPGKKLNIKKIVRSLCFTQDFDYYVAFETRGIKTIKKKLHKVDNFDDLYKSLLKSTYVITTDIIECETFDFEIFNDTKFDRISYSVLKKLNDDNNYEVVRIGKHTSHNCNCTKDNDTCNSKKTYYYNDNISEHCYNDLESMKNELQSQLYQIKNHPLI